MPVIACGCQTCNSEDNKDKRLRCSLLIEYNGKTFVIDAGPDFRQQMLRENVQHIDAILVTHEHKDHIAGMDDVRAFNFKSQKAIDIYCDVRVCEAIRREYIYVFNENKYPGVPQMNLLLIDDNKFNINGIEIIPILAYHHKLPVYGFRVGDLTYLTDVNMIPEESIELIRGSKVFVINALRKEKHISHFNLEEALELIGRVKPEKAFITHIGHQMGYHKLVNDELPPNVELAYDTLSYQL